ncbi:MAG: acyl-CoA thioesterase [Spirochaetales bacterium]|nr:acyl-CoA thioesterase [Spirochaetales bacterium]
MYKSETQIRVRYAETDRMGYVYYGNYAAYYEVARVESLRQLGLSYRELEDSGVIMPVLENCSKYLVPGRYDELLTVKVFIKKKPGFKIIFNYEIFNEENILINTGETKLAFIDTASSKPRMMPEEMQKAMAGCFV